MTESLRALLSGIVDYAGLFPPAGLPLDAAIRNYARFRAEPESWMLGRFICPAAKLGELSPYVEELFRDGPPLGASVLGRGGKDAGEFRATLSQDLSDLRAFCERHPGRVTAQVLEVRLPADVTHGDLRAAGAAIDKLAPATLTPFYEIDWAGDWRPALSAIAHERATPRERCRPAGAKLRCGGLEAKAFPPAEAIAAVITAARELGVPLKFTAGLHHPLPRFDGGVGATMHGFINVFLAGLFGASGATGKALMTEADPSHFAFTDAALRWADLKATLSEIEAARRDRVTSFGSCSFDEPRDDLRALGWL